LCPDLPTADCKGDVVLYAQLMKKGDGEYLRFTDIDMKIAIGGYHVRLDNLFNGDKFLGKTLLAENVTEIYVSLVLQKIIVALCSSRFNPR
jgi:hypothetical protein